MRLADVQFDSETQNRPEDIIMIGAALGPFSTPGSHVTKDGEFIWWHAHMVDLDKLPNTVTDYLIKKMHGRFIGPHDDFSRLGEIAPPQFNQKVKVSVGGNGLMNIRQVKVEEDCCTDRLGVFLSDGWCILAVCVQPDRRRPDYVLGKIGEL